MHVRPTTLADKAALVRMAINAYAESEDRGLVLPDPRAIARRLMVLRLAHFLRVVVDESDEPIGVIGAIAERHAVFDHAIVTRVLEWIDPAHRTKRAHKALHYAVEAWAREIGAAVVHMRLPRGEAMRDFAERQGYRPVLLESRMSA